MASQDDFAATPKAYEKNDTLCLWCQARRIQGKGKTCFHFECRQKQKTLNCHNSSKTRQKPKEKEMDTMCMYCKTRPVQSGRMVCFNSTCIERHNMEKFPPRVRVTTVSESHDSDENSSTTSSTSCRDDNNSDNGVNNDVDSLSENTFSDAENSNDDEESAEEEAVGDDDDDDSDGGTSTISANSDILAEIASNDSDHNPAVEMCENCHRKPLFDSDNNIDGTTLPYYFTVERVPKESIHFRRAYSNIVKSHYDNDDTVPLCKHCSIYLTGTGKEADTMEVKFPGYFWKLYSCTLAFVFDAQQKLWLIMPKVWRYWWLDEFNAVSLDVPPLQSEEIGIMQLQFEKGVQNGELKTLVETFDDLLNPLVLCPWGCTEYYHRCGYIAFDLIMQQHFQEIDLPLLSAKKCFSKVLSSRLDFIRDSVVDYECLLMNPLWRPLPSLVWLPKTGPCFATCRNHDNGTNKHYFHLPRFPEYAAIAAAMPDQLSHAVLKPRTLRSMKRSTFNTSYETVEMRGVYGGIDTCNITEFGNFNFQSHLTERNESLSIRRRPDIRALVNVLVAEKVLYPRTANNFLSRAEDYFQTCDFKKYMKGATYMTMEDCVTLQKILSLEDHVMLRPSLNSAMDTSKSYVLLWPRALVWVHPAECSYGARFGTLPLFRSRTVNTQLLWFLLGMMTIVPEVWSCTVESLQFSNQWNGFFLRLATLECMNIRKRLPQGQQKQHPFGGKTFKVDKLLQKIEATLLPLPFEARHITFAFRDMGTKVVCIPYSRDMRNTVWASITECTQACVIYVENREDTGRADEIEQSVDYELRQHESDNVFELVFIAFEEVVTRTGGWTGVILGRHGHTHHSWWNIKRGGKPHHERCSRSGRVNAEWSNLRYLVYARRNKADIRSLQEDYLTYIGGQKKVFCAIHNLPLIVTPTLVNSIPEYKCYAVGINGNVCHRKVGFRCPNSSCATWCCSRCVLEKQNATLRHNIMPHPSSSTTAFVPPSVFNGSTDYNTIVDLQSDWQAMTNPNHTNNIVQMEDTVVINPLMAIDDLHDKDDDVEESSGTVLDFPTTDSGVSALQVRHAAYSECNYQVPCHIVLNQCGTLLVRRSNELKGGKREQFFLQKLVSTSQVTIPILYPEGMLFPSIFYSAANDGYSVVGAIPSPLLGQQGIVAANGFANLRDHARTRLTMYSSSSATDWRYKTFMFDALANAALNNKDSRMVVHRGYEQSSTATGMALRDTKDAFLSDMIDSRTVIQELAAAEKVDPFTIFFSLTCNQSHQPGLRHIRKWVNDAEWEQYYSGFDALVWRDQQEIANQVDQAASGLILRNWLEIQKLFLQHIEKSNDPHLFCHVDAIFAKAEYQDTGEKKALGNLSHLHMMICTKEKPWTVEGRAALENIIRAYAEDIVRDSEIEHYVDAGIFHTIPDDVFQARLDVRTMLGHGTCNFPRCLARVGPGPHDFRCRVPDNYYRSPNHNYHSYSEQQPDHTPEALQILLELKLVERYGFVDPPEYKALHPSLRRIQHYPPTMYPGLKISPAIPKLFLLFRSNQNIQIITTYQTSRYIHGYCADIDKNNAIFLSVHSKESNAAVIRANFLHNTKIKGSAMHEEKALQKKKQSSHPRACGKSLMEIQQIVLGYPANFTSINYIHVSTHPMEERRGFEKTAAIGKLNVRRQFQDEALYETPEDVLDSSLPVLLCRDSFVSWRRFSQSQKLTVKDTLFSSISLDKITRFSVRPPELRSFDTVGKYFTFFEISRERYTCPLMLELLVTTNFNTSCWIDGLGNMVTIRPLAIPAAFSFLQSYSGPHEPPSALKKIFRNLDKLHRQANSPEGFLNEQESIQWQDLSDRLVARNVSKKLPVVVFSTIKPKNATRFLVHVLLSMGQFETEFELLAQPSMRAAFVKCHLFETTGRISQQEQSFNKLLTKFIVEELAFYPVTTRSLDYYLVQAKQIFYDVLIRDEMPIFELPPVLFTSLRDVWTESVTREISKMKEIHVDVCLKELHHLPGIPTKQELMEMVSKDKPHGWKPELEHDSTIQSIESHTEQVFVVRTIQDAIYSYSEGTNTFTRSLIVNGPPGCGKTFIMMVASLYALARGLTVTPTALMAERASTLGGTYIHRLFCIPPTNYTAQRLAEMAVLRLLRKPTLLQFLLSLDVLCWDELGQNAAQLLSTCDIIMRRIRGSDLFFGGVLLICTLDHLQLRPIKGLPLLLSPHIMTSFKLLKLKYLVRASQDPFLERIIDICRMSPSQYAEQSGVLDELRMLLSTHCTWVDNWDSPSIPSNATRCFGMRQPALQAEARYIEQIQSQCLRNGKVFLTIKSTDLQQPRQSHAPWRQASASVTSQLNRLVREPASLAIFEFAIYEFTYNLTGQFSQTQLAILCDVPDQETLDSYKPFQVLCAPPGTKYIDFEVTSKQQLIDLRWTETNVTAAPQFTRSLRGGMKARRQQYGLRPHVSNTFHGAMGATLSKVATEINISGKRCQLWEKGQVVVLVSRTRYCKDLIFVGSKTATLDVIISIVQAQTQYDQYIEHILQVLTVGGNDPSHGPRERVIEDSNHVLRPNDIPLPEAGVGCCYLLVSTKNFKVTYIGQTIRQLGVRLHEHNSGNGSIQTREHTLRPWGILAFVTGFDGRKQDLLLFEMLWEQKRYALYRHFGNDLTTDAIVDAGKDLLSNESFQHLLLALVVKGKIHPVLP